MCAASFQRLSSPALRWRHSSDVAEAGPLGPRRRRRGARRDRRRCRRDERPHQPPRGGCRTRARDRLGVHRHRAVRLGSASGQQPRIASGGHRLRLPDRRPELIEHPGRIHRGSLPQLRLHRHDHAHAARGAPRAAVPRRSPHRDRRLPARDGRGPAAVPLLRPVVRVPELPGQRLPDQGQPVGRGRREHRDQPARRRAHRARAPQPHPPMARGHARRAPALHPDVRGRRGADDRADREPPPAVG